MSDPFNALNAFAGIQRCFEVGEMLIYHLQGIPFPLLDNIERLKSYVLSGLNLMHIDSLLPLEELSFHYGYLLVGRDV